MAKPKRKLTAAERRAKSERNKKFMTIFINGKQKRVPRPSPIDELTEDEFLLNNADPIWLHQMELWHLIPSDSNGSGLLYFQPEEFDIDDSDANERNVPF